MQIINICHHCARETNRRLVVLCAVVVVVVLGGWVCGTVTGRETRVEKSVKRVSSPTHLVKFKEVRVDALLEDTSHFEYTLHRARRSASRFTSLLPSHLTEAPGRPKERHNKLQNGLCDFVRCVKSNCKMMILSDSYVVVEHYGNLRSLALLCAVVQSHASALWPPPGIPPRA